MGRDYHYDQIIMLGDWMYDFRRISLSPSNCLSRHDLSEVIVTDLLGPNGYRGSTAAPVPDSLLLNGVGVFNCSDTSDPCTLQTIPEVPVVPKAKYRFRLINYSSHGETVPPRPS